MKEKLQESLCLRDLAITTDIWTSRATQAYSTITAHYISDEWRIESCALVKWLKGIQVVILLRGFEKFWRCEMLETTM